jgi:hypothetical protein
MNTNLKLVFVGSAGKKLTFSYPFAKTSAPAAQIKTLMQIMVSNGDIFSEAPLTLDTASFVTNTVTPVNIA